MNKTRLPQSKKGSYSIDQMTVVMYMKWSRSFGGMVGMMVSTNGLMGKASRCEALDVLS
jgi:hypothetical protein